MNFNEYLFKSLEEDEELRKEYEALEQEYKLEGAMIGASNKAGFTKQQLFVVLAEDGLVGVYDLGMKHMYEYLEK